MPGDAGRKKVDMKIRLETGEVVDQHELWLTNMLA